VQYILAQTLCATLQKQLQGRLPGVNAAPVCDLLLELDVLLCEVPAALAQVAQRGAGEAPAAAMNAEYMQSVQVQMCGEFTGSEVSVMFTCSKSMLALAAAAATAAASAGGNAEGVLVSILALHCAALQHHVYALHDDDDCTRLSARCM
jgi:hypothetical protein